MKSWLALFITNKINQPERTLKMSNELTNITLEESETLIANALSADKQSPEMLIKLLIHLNRKLIESQRLSGRLPNEPGEDFGFMVKELAALTMAAFKLSDFYKFSKNDGRTEGQLYADYLSAIENGTYDPA